MLFQPHLVILFSDNAGKATSPSSGSAVSCRLQKAKEDAATGIMIKTMKGETVILSAQGERSALQLHQS